MFIYYKVLQSNQTYETKEGSMLAINNNYNNLLNTNNQTELTNSTNLDNTTIKTIDLSVGDAYITIESFSEVIVILNLTSLPDYLVFNEHYSLSVTKFNATGSYSQSLPNYLKEINIDNSHNNKLISFRIFNFNNVTQRFIVSINIKNEMFVTTKEYFADIANYIKYYPSRASIGTNKLFFFVITSSSTNNYDLPFNMYSNSDYDINSPLLVDYIPITNKSFTYDHNIEEDPFTSTYWASENLKGLVLPWIPYFSNCAGYDSRILLYDLLELNEGCLYPEANSFNFARQIPYTGLSTISDLCQIDLACRYDEIRDSSTSINKNKWFSIDTSRILFYITSYPLEYSDANNKYIDIYINNITSIDSSFIPAIIHPINYKENCLPTLINIEIDYYQEDENSKKIVNFAIKLQNYTNCAKDNSTTINNPFYSLSINYRPLNYIDLVNQFQFTFPIYIIIFLIVGLLYSLGLLSIWGLHNISSKIKHKTPFNMLKQLYLIQWKSLRGILIILLPVSLLICLLFLIKSSSFINGFAMRFEDIDSVTIDDNYINATSTGRTGLGYLILAFFIVIGSIKIFIPIPDEDERQNIEQEHFSKENNFSDLNDSKVKIKNNLKDNGTNTDSSFISENSENEKENLFLDYNKLFDPLIWKRRVFFIKFILPVLMLLIKLEFSYSTIYGENLYLFVIAYGIFDFIFEEITLKILLKEALLVSPLISVNKIVAFLCILGANDFGSFLCAYLIKLSLKLFIRLYITPILDNIYRVIYLKLKSIIDNNDINTNNNKKNVKEITNSRGTIKVRLSKFIANSFFEENNYTKTSILNLDNSKNIDTSKTEFQRKNTIEVILRLLLNTTTDIISLYLIPFVLMTIWIFRSSTKFTEEFAISSSNLVYYIIFSVVITIPETLMDLICINIIELFYGYKILEYLNYSNFRFNIRTSIWIDIKATIDPSITLIYRSLDAMLFSDQYFVMVITLTCGGIMLLIGTIITLRNSYNPFDDPGFLVHFIIIYGILISFFYIFKYTYGFFNLWKNASLENKINANEGNLLEFLNISKLNSKNIARFMSTDIFRHKFIANNKNWIIENLEKILEIKDEMTLATEESEEDKQIKDELENIYQKAVNYQAIDEQIQAKREIIKKDLQHMPYNLKNQEGKFDEDFGIRLDISKDSDNDYEGEKLNDNYNQNLIKQQLTQTKILIAKSWLYKAKEILLFKRWSSEVINDYKRNKCNYCSSIFNLHIIQDINFEKLVQLFKREFIGVNFDKHIWIKYYKNNQKFLTLCMECAYVQNFKRVNRQLLKEEKERDYLNKDKLKINEGDIKNSFKNGIAKKILYNWLMDARSKILINKFNNKSKI